MRTGFDDELEVLYVDMIRMGSLAEESLSLVAVALSRNGERNLERIEELSRIIDEKEREIENLCLKLLLRRQPVARDLRTISSAMKMIVDIERIGDNAGDISEMLKFISSPILPSAVGLDVMSRKVIDMVTAAVDAFVKSDAQKAEQVIAGDDAVDGCFVDAKEKITELIRKASPEAEEAPDLLMIAKYLERMGDHAASLARWVKNALE